MARPRLAMKHITYDPFIKDAGIQSRLINFLFPRWEAIRYRIHRNHRSSVLATQYSTCSINHFEGYTRVSLSPCTKDGNWIWVAVHRLSPRGDDWPLSLGLGASYRNGTLNLAALIMRFPESSGKSGRNFPTASCFFLFCVYLLHLVPIFCQRYYSKNVRRCFNF